MSYYRDSEGNWAEEITFSDLETQGDVKVADLFTGKDSVFYRESPTKEEIEKKEKRLTFLQLVIGSLTSKQREVIILSFNHHKSNRDIARILNISEDAVAQRKSQALKKLRKILMGK